jgi:putative hydrolase of the HAD superfamily
VLKAASPVWLFDLDNTLHDAGPHIFPHINRSMVEYIRDHLGIEEDEATRIRQVYWQRYGATLLGMMRHHGTDARHSCGTLTSSPISSTCWSLSVG